MLRCFARYPRSKTMPVIGLPALATIALIGLFVSACNEDTQSTDASAAKPQARAEMKTSQEPVDPQAPRMLEPTKPGGSGTSAD
jgi:hypothetical protein